MKAVHHGPSHSLLLVVTARFLNNIGTIGTVGGRRQLHYTMLKIIDHSSRYREQFARASSHFSLLRLQYELLLEYFYNFI